jgi:hypothetical protein
LVRTLPCPFNKFRRGRLRTQPPQHRPARILHNRDPPDRRNVKRRGHDLAAMQRHPIGSLPHVKALKLHAKRRGVKRLRLLGLECVEAGPADHAMLDHDASLLLIFEAVPNRRTGQAAGAPRRKTGVNGLLGINCNHECTQHMREFMQWTKASIWAMIQHGC